MAWFRGHGPSQWLRARVQPRAHRDSADGDHDGCRRLRLNAPPVDGKANAALIKWLAVALGVTRAQVTLAHGSRARHKIIEVQRPRGPAWITATGGS